MTTENMRDLAIEILDDLESTEGYIGDYFWPKWYEDNVADYRERLGLPAKAPTIDGDAR